MKEINVKELQENPFVLFADKWALVTAGNEEKCNTMTVSWGGVGILWGKCVATIYIRPQRYTKEFVDREEYFTVSVLPEEYRKALSFCGSKSGRDMEDKFAAAGITKDFIDNTPYVKEANLVLVCKKLYEDNIKADGFYDKALPELNYAAGDFHQMYIAEIVKAYIK